MLPVYRQFPARIPFAAISRRKSGGKVDLYFRVPSRKARVYQLVVGFVLEGQSQNGLVTIGRVTCHGIITRFVLHISNFLRPILARALGSVTAGTTHPASRKQAGLADTLFSCGVGNGGFEVWPRCRI